jgi:spore coat protein U-like protein
MPRKTVKILAALAVLLLAGIPASAGTINQTFNATARVDAVCVMSTIGDLAFGTYDPVSANASTGLSGNTTFTLTCTRGASPVVSLSLGNANFGQGLAGKRAMNNGSAGAGNFLSYDLFVPNGVGGPGSTSASPAYWGDGTSGTSTFSPSVPNINAQTITIFGVVPPAQDVAAAISYTDSVTATVNF